MRSKKIIITFILLHALCSYSHGGILFSSGEGRAGMAFLKIAPDARSSAMGSAYVGIAQGAYGMYYNPAGLSYQLSAQAAATHCEWVAGVRFESLAAAFPCGKRRGAGVTIMGLYTGDMERREELTRAHSGTFSAYDINAAFGMGQAVTEHLAAGASVKMIYELIDTYSVMSVAADIGLLYRREFEDHTWQWGFSLLNIGFRPAFIERAFSLPLAVQTGPAFIYRPAHLPVVWTSAAALVESRGEAAEVRAGSEIEYRLTHSFSAAVRAGYRTGLASSLGSWSGMSAGMGIRAGGMELDYVWMPYGYLGNTHRWTASVTF